MSIRTAPAGATAQRRPVGSAAPAAGRRTATWLVPAAAALLLSVAWSWRPALWTDEDATVSAVTRPLPELVDLLGRIDAVHAVYYLLLHPWVGLVGASPFAVRFPSAVAAAAAAAAVALVGRRTVGSERAGLACGLAWALVPTVSSYGMEARSPALSAALAGWATVVFLRAADSGQRRWWLGYGVVLGAGTAVHVYVALLAGAHAVALATTRPGRRQVVRFLGGGLVAMVLAGPVLVTAARQSGQVSWLSPARWADLPLQVSGLWFEGSAPVALAVWALVALGVLRLVRRRGEGVAAPGALAVAVPWAVVPFAVVYPVSTRFPLFTARYLFFCLPALAVLAGAGITAFRARIWSVLLLVGLAGAGVRLSVADRSPTGKGDDLHTVERIVAQQEAPGDAVLWEPDTRRLAAIANPSVLRGLDDVALDRSPVASNSLWGTRVGQAELRRRLAGVRRVWVVERPGRRRPSGSDVRSSREALDADGFTVTRTWDTGLSQLTLLTRR